MKLELTLDLTAALVSTTMVTQENILDMLENYHIGKTVTVTGVLTSDDNLGSVRYLQDSTASIDLYPGQDWSAWEATPQICDSLSVTGEITEYNGLLEVGPNLTDVSFFGQTYAFTENNFDAASASVYIGYGFRSNFSFHVRI